MKKTIPKPTLVGVAMVFSACLKPLPPTKNPSREVKLQGLPQLTESSGICISDKGMIWTHNDSGDQAVLYAFDLQGRHRASLKLASTLAVDWEDICIVRHAGKTWIAIGDFGDNNRRRKAVLIHLIECPNVAKSPQHENSTPLELIGSPALTIEFTYPDGPVDAECLCFDPIKKCLIVGSKEFVGCRLFELPIKDLPIFSSSTGPQAQNDDSYAPRPSEKSRLVKMPAIPAATLPFPLATGADISPNGKHLVLCGYGPGALIPRKQDEWDAPAIHMFPLPKRRQGEAICFSADGSQLLLTSELGPSPNSTETPLHIIPTPKPKAKPHTLPR